MARKTITIDLEAYELLCSRKGPGQSFSDVIKSGMQQGTTGRELAKALASVTLAGSTLDAIDRVIASRSKSPARRVKI